MPVKKVLILCLLGIVNDPRPRRAATVCRTLGYTVEVSSPRVPPIRNNRLLLLMRLLARIIPTLLGKWRLIEWICGIEPPAGNYDVILVEDIGLLPLAFRIRGDARVLFDAREYYPRQDESNFWFRLLERHHRILICREYLRRCDAVVTVSPGLADAYRDEYGVDTELVRSVPARSDQPVNQVSEQRIRIVHHGVANPNRNIELMVDIANALAPKFTCDFYLTGDQQYIEKIASRAIDTDSVRFMKPVAFEEIIPMLNRYDIGMFFLPPVNFNVEHILPNKLFEFIQARLAVAVSPSPDMAALVRRHGCGVVSESYDPATMITALQALSADQIMAYKRASDVASHELCFEMEGQRLAAIIQKLAA